ncbi:unnamed protein product [Parascedosporium putredinis]|uniref:Uncharacterized protein n=1 Tax=Parascedosporium putredinis TaxID=1442378 RepID=A0A9P1MA38_9PEZI|nr:unnamed protein product [Parascedosporium putredinis]CAI7991989.1 unnamed protein product [Parascedosporium putredinis]
MPIPVQTTPPDSRTSYIIDQLEGERITIPGSKGVFRILASEKQTGDSIAVFQSGAVLSDAPGFHWHNEAHDVFLCTKGFIKLWNGDKCRILGPGDFAYIPPVSIRPHLPANWVDFFRYVSEPYDGILAPATDDRDLRALLVPKVIAAKDRFDVHFVRDPTFANMGPRWMVGGVLSRPFLRAAHVEGRFAISSIESSGKYPAGAAALARWFTFPAWITAFGLLRIKLKGQAEWDSVREGQTVVLSAGETFTLDFGSRFVRAFSFTNGPGIEEVIHEAGAQVEHVVLPDEVGEVDQEKFSKACETLGVTIEAL